MPFAVNQVTLIGEVVGVSKLWFKPSSPHPVPCRRVMVRTTGTEPHDSDPTRGDVTWTNTAAVIVAGKTAELNALAIGARIYAFGRLRHRHMDRDGRRFNITEVHASRFYIRDEEHPQWPKTS